MRAERVGSRAERERRVRAEDLGRAHGIGDRPRRDEGQVRRRVGAVLGDNGCVASCRQSQARRPRLERLDWRPQPAPAPARLETGIRTASPVRAGFVAQRPRARCTLADPHRVPIKGSSRSADARLVMGMPFRMFAPRPLKKARRALHPSRSALTPRAVRRPRPAETNRRLTRPISRFSGHSCPLSRPDQIALLPQPIQPSPQTT